MTAQVARREHDVEIATRGEDVVAFALLALAMIMFMAWPKSAVGSGNHRPKQRNEPEGPPHPYRRAASRQKPLRTWIWKVPRRDD